eukprot:maker-scaffold22_size673200-snap-gene-5.45 protein:Tk12711 transcript:maker-scaffold22_size673200-snap-gene-5.45-mRNA-1 annotation:"hypothetical protein DAPPUDRAFT_323315"
MSDTTSPRRSQPLAPVTSLAASQNLPAVLNDPAKGKQKDFFTRSWGDSFNEHRVPASSSHLPEVQDEHLERYRRKLRKHALIIHERATAAPASPTAPGLSAKPPSTSVIERSFLDPNFDLSRPETFAAIFKFKPDKSLVQQVKSDCGHIQEGLSHQLDAVEVDIAHQVAQKSHNFFQVMTYHDALMTQLKALVKLITRLRANLASVDEGSLKPSLKICQLKRHLSNAQKVLDKLSLMSFLHQTQPTIQVLLTTSEFSGALDLITTSCEIMAVDLKGVVSFRHLTSQLTEIKTIIGKILLEDFQTFISSEIGRETIHIKATTLSHVQKSWTEFDTDQLRGVIYGLLRQNSYTFLEALEDASVSAIKGTMKEVILNCTSQLLPNIRENITLTSLVGEFAQKATSEEWIDLFDVLIGSLIVLLQRIGVIHKVITDSINSANLASDGNPPEGSANSNGASVIVPEDQLRRLLSTSQEVLINICDQMNERCAKLLTQRSKGSSITHITTQELTSVGLLVSIMASESFKQSQKPCAGLQLCLQGQSVMFIQNFHEEQRLKLSEMLHKETWRKNTSDFGLVLSRLSAIPSMSALFLEAGSLKGDKALNGGPNSSPRPLGHQFHVMGQDYSVVEVVAGVLKILAEYCNLCSMLPSITVELGLKTAEFIKFFNSRTCQLVLGAGAISVSGLKTITIRNLALATRSVELIRKFIPSILDHFQACYREKLKAGLEDEEGQSAALNTSPGSTKAETRQFEVLKRQFDQASKHLENHCVEMFTKIYLASELTFYGQCVLRLEVLPEDALTREAFEAIWTEH